MGWWGHLSDDTEWAAKRRFAIAAGVALLWWVGVVIVGNDGGGGGGSAQYVEDAPGTTPIGLLVVIGGLTALVVGSAIYAGLKIWSQRGVRFEDRSRREQKRLHDAGASLRNLPQERTYRDPGSG